MIAGSLSLAALSMGPALHSFTVPRMTRTLMPGQIDVISF